MIFVVLPLLLSDLLAGLLIYLRSTPVISVVLLLLLSDLFAEPLTWSRRTPVNPVVLLIDGDYLLLSLQLLCTSIQSMNGNSYFSQSTALKMAHSSSSSLLLTSPFAVMHLLPSYTRLFCQPSYSNYTGTQEVLQASSICPMPCDSDEHAQLFPTSSLM